MNKKFNNKKNKNHKNYHHLNFRVKFYKLNKFIHILKILYFHQGLIKTKSYNNN